MEDLLDTPQIKPTNKVNYAAPIVWGSLVIVGVLFRIQHWPGGSFLIVCSSAALTGFTFSKIIFVTKFKNPTLLMIGLMCLAWLFVLVGGALFNNGHPYNFLGVRAYAISFVLLFGIHTLINTLRNRKSKPDSPKR